MPYSKEIKGEWFGVKLPEWLRFFDCREEQGKEGTVKAPWGETLWASERAQVDLGLKTGYGDRNGHCPTSCSFYFDARTAGEAEVAKLVRDALNEAERLRADYEHAKQHQAKPGEGGGCYYMPVAFALGNYGWSIIADDRSCVVRRFGCIR